MFQQHSEGGVGTSRLIFTARKRSCGKVMFLHMSVCSQGGVYGWSEGGEGVHDWRGMCGWGGLHGWVIRDRTLQYGW